MTDQTITQNEPKKKKSTRVDKSLLIRMSAEERAIFDKRLADSGYKAAGAFVRDYIINAKPQRKFVINPDADSIIAHAATLFEIINSDTAKNLSETGKAIMVQQLVHIMKYATSVLEQVKLNAKSEEGEGYDW